MGNRDRFHLNSAPRDFTINRSYLGIDGIESDETQVTYWDWDGRIYKEFWTEVELVQDVASEIQQLWSAMECYSFEGQHDQIAGRRSRNIYDLIQNLDYFA